MICLIIVCGLGHNSLSSYKMLNHKIWIATWNHNLGFRQHIKQKTKNKKPKVIL